jgi:hypothetical protein
LGHDRELSVEKQGRSAAALARKSMGLTGTSRSTASILVIRF